MAIPKLRFKEFDNDWLTTDLGKICSHFQSGKSITSKDISDSESFPVYGGNGLRGFTDIFTHEGKFILVGRQGALCGNVNLVDGLNYISEHAIAIQANTENSTDLLAYWLDKMNLNRFSEASAQPGLAVNKLVKFKITLPQVEEQTKIASFLSSVDDRIAQLTQEHELLTQYKKGMMQQLFSQNLRFKADDGSDFEDWEERKLSEVGENIIGLTYSPKDLTNDGSGILVLRSSNIKNGRLDKRDQVRVNKVLKDRIIIQQNDILICARNGSQRLIGKSVLINDTERMTFGAFMSVYRSQYNHFISYLMQSSWFFEQVQMNLGARINQITTGTLNEFTFDFPTMEEQTKIANFLSAIDQKIDNVAAQIDQAKVWKKGLLQQMFV